MSMINIHRKVAILAVVATALGAGPAWAGSGQVDVNGTTGSDVQKDIQRQIEELKLRELLKGPRFSLVGPVAVGRHARYSINGEDFDVGEQASVSGEMRLGAFAEVSGPLPQSGKKVADHVIVANPRGSDSAGSQEPAARRREPVNAVGM